MILFPPEPGFLTMAHRGPAWGWGVWAPGLRCSHPYPLFGNHYAAAPPAFLLLDHIRPLSSSSSLGELSFLPEKFHSFPSCRPRYLLKINSLLQTHLLDEDSPATELKLQPILHPLPPISCTCTCLFKEISPFPMLYILYYIYCRC